MNRLLPLLEVTLFSLGVLILTGCCSTNYCLMKHTDFNEELFVIPPSGFFDYSIDFDDNGKIKRRIQPIAVLNLLTSKSTKSEGIKVRRSRDKITCSLISDNSISLLKLKGHFRADGLFNIYMVWNYELLYDDDSGHFKYRNFVRVIDQLRAFLVTLETSPQSTSLRVVHTDLILGEINSFKDNILLKEGQSQVIINACFENLPLPNSVMLYNYGYLGPYAMSATYRGQFTYFLEDGFGLNAIQNPIVKDADCNEKPVFGLGATANLALTRYADGGMGVATYQLGSNGVCHDCEGSNVGNSPIDFRFFKGRYLFLYSGPASPNNLRNPYNIEQPPRGDVALIAVDDLRDADKIIDLDNPSPLAIKRQLKELGDQNKWYRLKSSYDPNLYDRLFLMPVFPIYFAEIYSDHRYKGFLTYGSTPNELGRRGKYEIQRTRIGELGRFRINRNIRGISDPRLTNEEYNQLLLLPYDEIRSK